jgi:peptidoglycan-N-acetylglucosamine deacetylase
MQINDTTAMTVIGLLATLGFVAAAIVALTYVDYRLRKPWAGYVFGHPLHGFDKQIFLTFDDGPSAFGKIMKTDNDRVVPICDADVRAHITNVIPDYDFDRTATENLLALLERKQVSAIFFLLGQSIDRNPQGNAIVRMIAAKGHAIGNHSYSHLYSRRDGLATVLDDFERNHQLIQSITGNNVELFRPPFGDWSANLTKEFLSRPALAGYTFPLFWTTMCKEWALKSSADLDRLGELLAKVHLSLTDGKGKIILLHDTYIPAVLLASLIIDEAKRHGYRVGNPQDLINAAAAETALFRNAPFLYHITVLAKRIQARLTRKSLSHTNFEVDS